MTAFILIPGAGGMAWYWHRVVPLLERAGHEALAVDLPGDDDSAGIHAYADRVVAAIGARGDVTLVAQSMGAFTAALVSVRARPRRLIFVNAMIPNPGETPGQWWKNTGWEEARVVAAKRGGYGVELDLATYFFHDVPSEIVEQGAEHERAESKIAFSEPADFGAWSEVPIHVVVGRDDRFFPNEFQARIARERLGAGVDEIAGGHLVALSRPHELADRLLTY
jgi:pimeloyl-ACP methyl ester carboxylesterase